MKGQVPRLILASGSSARLRVLNEAGLRADAIVSGVSEDVDAPDTATAVRILAERKALAVADDSPNSLVIGCDSLLEVDGRALGKPTSVTEAIRYWEGFSGRSALFHTGQCVVDTRSGRSTSDVVVTEIRFGTPTKEEIEAYVATSEPLLTAGGFTIEGFGAPFIDGIEGDPTNVYGISIPLLRKQLRDLGTAITDLWS